MENERDQQDVLMALQGMGRMSLMMDPVFKLTATGTILLIQHFAPSCSRKSARNGCGT